MLQKLVMGNPECFLKKIDLIRSLHQKLCEICFVLSTFKHSVQTSFL